MTVRRRLPFVNKKTYASQIKTPATPTTYFKKMLRILDFALDLPAASVIFTIGPAGG